MTEAKRRVIVTGSTGNLGEKAVAALKRLDNLDVICMGRNSGRDANVITADLGRFDSKWAHYFESADAVLHLAADPKPTGSWDSVTRVNIDLALNVFRAAEEARVRRFVFASSNWVLGGYRFSQEALTASLPAKPINPYGASKLFLERYGLALATRSSMSVLSLRIGYCQPGENIPGPHMAFGKWGQQMWLGNKDWEQAACKAVTSPYEGAAVLNVVSRNDGMRWDIEAARRIIGYEPEEHHTPTLKLAGSIKEAGARLRDRTIPPSASSALFGARW
jgi:NAD+ dependent glucose-6-phosphate dehydrogenase